MILSVLYMGLLTIIPSELTLRDQSVTTIVGFGLFAAFILISITKLLRSEVFSRLALANLKINSIGSFVHDEFQLNKRESFLLGINYIVCFGLILFILVKFPGVNQKNELLFVGLFPISMLIASILLMAWTGLITGELKVMLRPILFKVVGAQLLGIVFFFLALAWTLVPIDETVFLNIVIWVFLIESIIRIYKSVIAVYSMGTSWYYIILYFCTLEISPLFVLFYFFGESFGLNF